MWDGYWILETRFDEGKVLWLVKEFALGIKTWSNLTQPTNIPAAYMEYPLTVYSITDLLDYRMLEVPYDRIMATSVWYLQLDWQYNTGYDSPGEIYIMSPRLFATKLLTLMKTLPNDTRRSFSDQCATWAQTEIGTYGNLIWQHPDFQRSDGKAASHTPQTVISKTLQSMTSYAK